MRRLLAIAAALVVLACPSAALAQDTSAVAVNTKDGSTIFRLAFQIKRTMKSTVDNSNAAVAVSSCDNCRTVAVAFQVVLAMGDVSQLTPTNLALAYNLDCTACDTAAFAYQLVTGDGQVVHFTAEGNRRLAEIRRQLEALRKAGLSDAELNTALDGIAADLGDIISTELVPAGRPPEATATPDAQPQPQPPPATPTPSPTDTATPTPTASPTPTDTPAPTATATPTP
jgi:putative peptide zinc metalloprotease protein